MTAQSTLRALLQLIYLNIKLLYCSNLGKPEPNQKQTPANDEKTGKEVPNHSTWINSKQR